MPYQLSSGFEEELPGTTRDSCTKRRHQSIGGPHCDRAVAGMSRRGYPGVVQGGGVDTGYRLSGTLWWERFGYVAGRTSPPDVAMSLAPAQWHAVSRSDGGVSRGRCKHVVVVGSHPLRGSPLDSVPPTDTVILRCKVVGEVIKIWGEQGPSLTVACDMQDDLAGWYSTSRSMVLEAADGRPSSRSPPCSGGPRRIVRTVLLADLHLDALPPLIDRPLQAGRIVPDVPAPGRPYPLHARSPQRRPDLTI